MLCSTGTSTDGEFEQLRRIGETRPLHIWQLAHYARDSVGKTSRRTLLQMLEMNGGMVSLYLKRAEKLISSKSSRLTFDIIGYIFRVQNIIIVFLSKWRYKGNITYYAMVFKKVLKIMNSEWHLYKCNIIKTFHLKRI